MSRDNVKKCNRKVYSKHFFRSVTRQKILNLELSFGIQSLKKNSVQINQKKTSCVLLPIYIFSRLTYTMKYKINSQVAFLQRLKKYSLTLCAA